MKDKDSINLFTESKVTIHNLIKQGCMVSIVTSNSRQLVEAVLKSYDIRTSYIVADISLTGKTKELKKLVIESGVGQTFTIYIGDEVRDIQAAKKARVKSGAVSWGYAHLDKLALSDPDFIFKKFSDILRLND